MVKLGARDFDPIFMAFLRSVIASMCLAIWIKLKGVPLFPSLESALHGLVTGVIFTTEFALIYSALTITAASRVYVILYTAPFFTAIGAHFFIKGDQLTLNKVMGLVLAFTGISVLFLKNISDITGGSFRGDLMVLASGALWGGLTVYIKKFLAGKVHPLQTLFYNIFFSIPFLLPLSLIFEDHYIIQLTWVGGFSLFYQSVIIAFITYLSWTILIHRHPVSLLHAFSFITPICGVFISGVLILREPLSARLFLSLFLVSIGLLLVNRAPKNRPAEAWEHEGQ